MHEYLYSIMSNVFTQRRMRHNISFWFELGTSGGVMVSKLD